MSIVRAGGGRSAQSHSLGEMPALKPAPEDSLTKSPSPCKTGGYRELISTAVDLSLSYRTG